MRNEPKIWEARIADDVLLGKGVKIVMPSNLYGCIIGDDCFIGPFVEIQKGTKIGDRTHMESHSFICEKVSIGHDCFIGHGVMFANDKFNQLGRAAYVEKEYWKEIIVGNNVTIGNNVSILPVRICDYAIIGAGSIVTKDIVYPAIYAGNPARFLKEHPNPEVRGSISGKKEL